MYSTRVIISEVESIPRNIENPLEYIVKVESTNELLGRFYHLDEAFEFCQYYGFEVIEET